MPSEATRSHQRRAPLTLVGDAGSKRSWLRASSHNLNALPGVGWSGHAHAQCMGMGTWHVHVHVHVHACVSSLCRVRSAALPARPVVARLPRPRRISS